MEDAASEAGLFSPRPHYIPPGQSQESVVYPLRPLGCGGRNQFPRLSNKQPPEELRYDYLLFFSNFNGTWNQYIDAFSAVLSQGLDLIWRWSEKYPGARPVTAFKRYIALVQFDTDYYYNVYPRATTNDVKAALRVQDALDQFASASQSVSPADFEKAWLEFLVRVQPDLGSTGVAPVGT